MFTINIVKSLTQTCFRCFNIGCRVCVCMFVYVGVCERETSLSEASSSALSSYDTEGEPRRSTYPLECIEGNSRKHIQDILS